MPRLRLGRGILLSVVSSLLTLFLVGCASLPESPVESGAPSRATSEWGVPIETAPAANRSPKAVPADVPVASADDPAYRIGPEDGLDISVWKEESLKSATLVRPDGGISFPLIGELKVAGKTAEEVRAELAARLARYVPDPVVTVSVVRVASYRVYVIGRVNKPGDIVVGRPIDVLQALSMAGGVTPFANESEIRIIRRIDGRQESLPFDYSRLRRGGDLSQNITLRSGDVLFVP